MSFASLFVCMAVLTACCVGMYFHDFCVCIGKEVTKSSCMHVQEVISEGV